MMKTALEHLDLLHCHPSLLPTTLPQFLAGSAPCISFLRLPQASRFSITRIEPAVDLNLFPEESSGAKTGDHVSAPPAFSRLPTLAHCYDPFFSHTVHCVSSCFQRCYQLLAFSTSSVVSFTTDIFYNHRIHPYLLPPNSVLPLPSLSS